MSTAFIVFQITLAFGQMLWKQNAINCLLQNKPVRIVITGSHAAAVGNALKVPLPTITWQHTKMTASLVMVIAIITVVYTTPLVDLLNAAFARGYDVKVRYKQKGAAVMDDEFIVEMLP